GRRLAGIDQAPAFVPGSDLAAGPHRGRGRPAPMAAASAHDPALARKLRRDRIDMDFLPVCDVASQSSDHSTTRALFVPTALIPRWAMARMPPGGEAVTERRSRAEALDQLRF